MGDASSPSAHGLMAVVVLVDPTGSSNMPTKGPLSGYSVDVALVW